MTITSLPSGSFFLENLPDIDILTAKTRLLVTIKIGDDTIYDEYLYPADGEVSVSDLADIFRPYARRRLAVTATITIAEQQVPDSGDTDSATVTDTQKATPEGLTIPPWTSWAWTALHSSIPTSSPCWRGTRPPTWGDWSISTTWARKPHRSPHTTPTKPQNCLPHQPSVAMTSTPPSTFLRLVSRPRAPTFSTTW